MHVCMTSSSKPATRALAGLGRATYVSQRGVEHVLQELHAAGLLDAAVATSRSSVKRARDDESGSWSNSYGHMIQHVQVPLEGNPSKTCSVPFIPPSVLLAHCAQQEPFASFLKERLQSKPCSHSQPWHIITYNDEITPGNTLKVVNLRRTQAIYWSVLEWGHRSLSSESMWFPLTALRSNVCQKLGGLTVILKYMLRTFVQPHDFRAGIHVRPCNQPHIVFGRLGVLVADESALKHSMENKGASGSLFCVRCTNIIGHKNAVADFSNDFVLSTCVDSAQFRLHTNASTRQLLEYLRDAEQSMSCAAFAKLQTSVGFNFKSSGLLMDDMIGYDIPETVMYDWFHIYLVHGVCNIECGLVLGGLRDAGFPESDITEFLQSFNWPAQTAGSSPKNILQAAREKKTSPLKASASELLNFVPVLRLFVLLFVCGRVDSATECKVHSFLLLVQVLDLLQIVARGGSTTAAELGAAIRKHLECHLKAHGDESWIPKMHMSLHLAEFLQRFGTLISCFVHERKHKLIKRFASQKQDTTKKYEESLLQDIMAVQLQALKQDMPSTEVRLLHKAKATKKLHELMHETLQCGGGECFHALRAVHGGGFECSRGDVVEFSCMGTSSFGRIQFHAEMMDRPMTCIVPWSHVHDWAYTVTESAQPVLVDTGAIKGCCLWSQKGTSALVIRA